MLEHSTQRAHTRRVGLVQHRGLSALALLTLSSLVALATPADGALKWSRPQAIGDGNSLYKGLHIDARGDLLATWTTSEFDPAELEYRVSTFYAWRAPGGRWTPASELGPVNGNPAVALSPRGRATAVWADGEDIVAAEASVGGEFRGTQVIGRTDRCCAATIDVVTDDEGNAMAAWSGEHVPQTEPGGISGRKIYAATRTPLGTWSAPELVRHGTTGGGPDLAMNAAGAAVIGWFDTANMDPYISYRLPAGRFGPAERVPSKHWGWPKVAIADDGEAVVATSSRSHTTTEPVDALMVTRRPLGGWTAPVSFSVQEPPRAVFAEPNGSATMFMADMSDPNHPQAQYVTRSVAGEVDGPTTVASDRGWTDIAMNLRGDIFALLWDRGPEQGRTEFAERPAGGGGFGAVQTVPGFLGASTNAVALNDAGHAAVMGTVGAAPANRVYVAVREDTAQPALPFPPSLEIDVPDTPQLDEGGVLRIAVRCSAACKALPTGILSPNGNAELVGASGSSKRIGAKQQRVLTIRFGDELSRAVRKAVRAGRKPWVSVSVRARGKSPRPMTVSRRIRLR
jgi:hypothetical protein